MSRGSAPAGRANACPMTGSAIRGRADAIPLACFVTRHEIPHGRQLRIELVLHTARTYDGLLTPPTLSSKAAN